MCKPCGGCSGDSQQCRWRLFLDKGKFEQALQYCKDPSQKDVVWSAQADHYFKLKKYDLAATFYGKTQRSFEDIALRFIKIGTVQRIVIEAD